MLKGIFRTGFAAGLAYGAYMIARRYWGSNLDHAVDSAKSTAKDIGKDFMRKDKAMTNSFENVSRQSM